MEVTKADAFGFALNVVSRHYEEAGLLYAVEDKATRFGEAWGLGGYITCDGVRVGFFPLEVATWFCVLSVTEI